MFFLNFHLIFLIATVFIAINLAETTSVCKPINLDTGLLYFEPTNDTDKNYPVSIYEGKLTASFTREAKHTFAFEQCFIPSICKNSCAKRITLSQFIAYGHIRDRWTGKCLHHDNSTSKFSLQTCPTSLIANDHLPFWFKGQFFLTKTDPVQHRVGSIDFIGHIHESQNPAAYSWDVTNATGVRFPIKTQTTLNGTANDWLLKGPPLRF